MAALPEFMRAPAGTPYLRFKLATDFVRRALRIGLHRFGVKDFPFYGKPGDEPERFRRTALRRSFFHFYLKQCGIASFPEKAEWRREFFFYQCFRLRSQLVFRRFDSDIHDVKSQRLSSTRSIASDTYHFTP